MVNKRQKTGGRKKTFDERVVLSMTTRMLGEIDAHVIDGEARLDFIRRAIQVEIDRRRGSETDDKKV